MQLELDVHVAQGELQGLHIFEPVLHLYPGSQVQTPPDADIFAYEQVRQ